MIIAFAWALILVAFFAWVGIKFLLVVLRLLLWFARLPFRAIWTMFE